MIRIILEYTQITASNTFRYAFRDYSDENSLKGGAAT